MSLGWLDKEGKSLGASLGGTSGPLPPPLPLNNPALLLSLGGLGILLPGIGHAGLDVHLIADGHHGGLLGRHASRILKRTGACTNAATK